MVFGCGCILLWCLSRSMGSSSSAPVLSKESQAIKEEVNKYPVVMYTKDKCPYCAYAKKELNENGVFFVERNFSEPGTTGANIHGLMELTRCRTVPQVFVCGRFIGGYNELHEIGNNLPKLIEECSSDGKVSDRRRAGPSSSKI